MASEGLEKECKEWRVSKPETYHCNFWLLGYEKNSVKEGGGGGLALTEKSAKRDKSNLLMAPKLGENVSFQQI